ncbi:MULTISPECIES: TonB-dependent receptor plug domain-containing protein, partial [Pseudomonas]
MSSRALPAVPFLLLSSCLLANAVHAAGQGDGSVIELGEQTVVATAQEETKQAPGVSIITAEDIAKRPPSNDLSQIIRTMPGVNLTGNSSSGQRGNNRQIDIRGM